MKKKLFYFSVLLFSFSLGNQAIAQKPGLNYAKQQKIDSLISSYYSDSLPGISILIAENNSVLLKKAIGMADMELNVKLSPDNVFAIGSTSKQFTAVAILKLVEQGKLDLRADIKTYLPGYNTHGQKITIENLLSHTSGISSFTEMKGFDKVYMSDLSPKEMISSFEDSALLFNPGTNWSYSNSGYLLSAYIIQQVSGKDFKDFMKEYLFAPAGMTHTYFGSNSDIIPMRAHGYDAAGENKVRHTDYYSWSWPWGAGNIMSTTGDMLAWNEALQSGKIIKKELLKKAFTPYILTNGISANYGYGWIINKVAGKTVISHGGAIGGYLADVARIEENGTTIIILTNTTAISPSDLLENILMVLLDVPAMKAQPLAKGQDLKEYEGVYEVNYSGGRITANSGPEKLYRTVTTDGNKLFIQRTGRSKIELEPFGKDLFFISNSRQQFRFVRDKKNQITALSATNFPLQMGPGDIGKKTDLPLPKPVDEIKVPVDILKKYVGTYELNPSFQIEFTIDGDQFFLQATGQPKFEVFAKTEKNFFLKVVDAKIDFNFDEQGNVVSIFLTQGRKMEAKKIR